MTTMLSKFSNQSRRRTDNEMASHQPSVRGHQVSSEGHMSLLRTNYFVAPQTVDCPACQKQVLMATINQHLDSGCKLPLSGEFEVGSSTSNKGKQKQDWQKLFGAADISKGKGKAKCVSQCLRFYRHLPMFFPNYTGQNLNQTRQPHQFQRHLTTRSKRNAYEKCYQNMTFLPQETRIP